MAEWLYEDGIGEARAALVEDGRIVAARIELPDGLRVGTVARGRLVEPQVVRLDRGAEVLLAAPAGTTIGAAVTVEVTREAIPERGRPKRARGRATADAERDGATLLDRIVASGHAVRRPRAHDADLLEQAGWSEALEEAATGEIGFAGGALRMAVTPAMTLFDVDGDGAADALALAGAVAAVRAVRRFGIGGSIGIDLPTVSGKAARLAVAAAVDRALPPPFERTAVNGFGFLQIVRPRPRASLPELLAADPVGAAARAALRAIERTPAAAPNRHRLPAAVLARIERTPAWTEALLQRTGRVPMFDR